MRTGTAVRRCGGSALRQGGRDGASCSRLSAVLCAYPIGHDDAIAAVKLDMNVSDPDRCYLPSRS